MITMVVFVKRKKGITREEFSRYWFEKHRPLVLSTPEFMQYVRKYVQHHPTPGHAAAGSLFGEIGDFDGVGEIWFDSREDMNKALNEPRYLATMRVDEYNFIDLDGCISFVSEERICFDMTTPKIAS